MSDQSHFQHDKRRTVWVDLDEGTAQQIDPSPCFFNDKLPDSIIKCREVLPGEITITREELLAALKRAEHPAKPRIEIADLMRDLFSEGSESGE